jgi:UTP--glucose-1-phosphate uridylyltransferase
VRITKAVITAAGRGLRQYPASDTVQKALLPLVDRDGLTKPVLQIIAEEALESGIEEICVVVAPGDEDVYRRHFQSYADMLDSAFRGVVWAEEQARRLAEMVSRLRFAVQPDPAGYGHAVWCARGFAGAEPILLLLGDHVYISSDHDRVRRRCARQLLDLAESEDCAVSAVQATREHLIHQYGTLSGKKIRHDPSVYQIEQIFEKPTPTMAELHLHVPGLRAGHYLCFFGMHVLTPRAFEILDGHVQTALRSPAADRPPIQLTTTLDLLAREDRYLALETQGTRHNLGIKYGFVEAQIALALAGQDRETMLVSLLESVARLEPRSRDT